MLPFLLLLFCMACASHAGQMHSFVSEKRPPTRAAAEQALSTLLLRHPVRPLKARVGQPSTMFPHVHGGQMVRSKVNAQATAVLNNAQESQKTQKKKQHAALGSPLVVGLTHKTAPVEIREKLAVPAEQQNIVAQKLCESDYIEEAAVLSTCNRFELYLVADDYDAAMRDVMSWLVERAGLPEEDLRPHLFDHFGAEATSHLFRVSSGLDSLIVGENQIQAQVKQCYGRALSQATEDEPAGSAGPVLDRMFNTALSAGKLIRTEVPELSRGGISISSAAVELANLKAEGVLGKPLSSLRVAVVGAGEMSKLLLGSLVNHNGKATLINRSPKSAEDLAAKFPDMDIEVVLMDELWPTLEKMDVVFTATGSKDTFITKAKLEAGPWGAEGQPLMLIDISVPRNVETECNDLPQVTAYDVDDLKEVVAANVAKRQAKVTEAELLLEVELKKFKAWQKFMSYRPTILALQDRHEEIRNEVIAGYQKKLTKNLNDEQVELVHELTKSLMKKTMSAPLKYLSRLNKKDMFSNSDADVYEEELATVGQLQELFHLEK
jgi:glutamyl-tRNA reductase